MTEHQARKLASLTTPLLLIALLALRLLGVRIGRGVYLDSTDFTEFDCVSIGDCSELNAWSGPQTHLFEDRIMKIGLIQIGQQVTLGTRSTVPSSRSARSIMPILPLRKTLEASPMN